MVLFEDFRIFLWSVVSKIAVCRVLKFEWCSFLSASAVVIIESDGLELI